MNLCYGSCYGYLCLGSIGVMDLYVMDCYELCLGLLYVIYFYVIDLCYGLLCNLYLTFNRSHMDKEDEFFAFLILLWSWLMLV